MQETDMQTCYQLVGPTKYPIKVKQFLLYHYLLKFVDITQNFRPKYNGFSYIPFLKNIIHERQKTVSSFTLQKKTL